MSDAESTSKPLSWFGRLLTWMDQEPKDRQDLLAELKDAFENNIIDADAWRMLQGVIELSALKVRDIMVPRAQMVTLDVRASLQESLNVLVNAQHSRYPVVGETRDHVVGVLMAKDLLMSFIRNGDAGVQDLSPLLRPVFFVPEGKRAAELLREFQSRRLHLAVVVDEYGGVSGLVTIEDIIEAIVGEIEDEYDETDEHILQMDEQTFTVKAVTPIEEVSAFFDVELMSEQADTIGGLLVTHFGRVPHTGESVEIAGLLFKVLRADRRRIHLLKVSPVVAVPDTEANA